MRLLYSLLLFFLAVCTSSFASTLHGGSIIGVVVDLETNVEVSGATVQLLGTDQYQTTNNLGIFTFTGLASGEYTVRITLIGYAIVEKKIAVADFETTNIKLSLETIAFVLDDVEITVQQSKPLATISQIDILKRPINTAQDILRFVPGLVIAQHAGGGKAEQIFLRGFDIDHGTDIALFADGMPVNMVSHAHGQGYADLHFLIPELVEKVDFQKGPYFAQVGNLATAGYVKFQTPDALRQNLVSVEVGQFDTYRSVAAIDLLGKRAAARGTNAYIASETVFSNGYFEAPQDFKRFNLFAKFRQTFDEGKVLTISASRFSSAWMASGQIPERAIRSGQISRFGTIDPTEGGRTTRTNLNIQHATALTPRTVVNNQFYVNHYDFELYSNFTFFLNNPEKGDQIKQKENRIISGYNGSIVHETNLLDSPLRLEGGAQVRYDDVDDIELSRTYGRKNTLNRLALGDLQEINLGLYADAQWRPTSRLNVQVGTRFDQFLFSYQNNVDSLTAFRSAAKSIASPKLNLNYQINPQLQVFAQSGSGFHSNDTRVILGATNTQILPRAIGFEGGFIWKPYSKLLINLSAWQLNLEQEFVYVGDESVVEPSGATTRKGIDLGLRWQATPWLFVDADYNFTRPRTNGAEAAPYIPLAPTQTSIGGITITSPKGLDASLRYRYLADRAANEDYSLTAQGWFLLDAQASWRPKWKNGKSPVQITVSLQNIANTPWKEAQFETESRLMNEAEPVSEIHFTPGTPFFAKTVLTFRF